jgi:hypothetical protein
MAKFRFQENPKFIFFGGITSVSRNLKSCHLPNGMMPYLKKKYLNIIFLNPRKPARLPTLDILIKIIAPVKTQHILVKDCSIPDSEAVNWNEVYTLPFKCSKSINYLIFNLNSFIERLQQMFF